MLQRLVLVRHGEAEFLAPDGMDENRNLTGRGLLAIRGSFPQTFEPLQGCENLHFWVSPAARARQTALVVAHILGHSRKEFEYHDSLYKQDDETFFTELADEGDGTVIVVGHDPFVKRVLRQLTGENREFPNGTAASLLIDKNDLSHATLEWFVLGPEETREAKW